ncbi:inositol monophosphatase 2 isoform X2 [Carcharodon carcharias]|uniref:inositol monophosphatase 2 isoform X2 n=1 Tax=Carcharodon carcharias TaxID=13397 RepID=UPI001B7D9764|nr:inositol monophosphatase 2 isoform X2 [Carcharodon carcharias]
MAGSGERSSQQPLEECLEAAVQVALEAGQIIREALRIEKRVQTKSSAADLVTETDQLVENLIISTLSKKFPSHRFIGEESVAAGEKCILTDDPTWIIDPIDGTCNFVHGAPVVAVSIGLSVKKELELGVIYSCVEEKLYTGRKGHGAFCNGQKLQASNQTDLSKALILTELGSIRDPVAVKMLFNNMERLLKVPAHGIRIVGSAALDLCHVAAGDVDAFYQFGLHCWDMAAAAVIVREAGGIMMDTAGGPLDLMSRRVVAAGTPEMACQIAKELQPVAYERDDGTEGTSNSLSK